MRAVKKLLFVLVSALVTGCASYHAQPLDTKITFSPADRIKVDFSSLSLPKLQSREFNPSDGFDINEVAMLAVANSLSLKVARADAGVARAMVFSAGLLPDPQISFSQDFLSSQQPGGTSAFNIGVNFNLVALLLRASSKAAANADARSADLALLWQEWQIANQAKISFVRIIALEKAHAILAKEQALYRSLYAHSENALASGDRTIDAASLDYAALQGLNLRFNDNSRQVAKARHELNALLGIHPHIKLPLADTRKISTLNADEVAKWLPNIARRRPDLLALQWGYGAQEARLRQAIWNQYPPIDLGLTRARDTGNLYTTGYTLNTLLPLLNGNKGQISQEAATREKLKAEFQLRLTNAVEEVRQLCDDNQILAQQLAKIRLETDETNRAALSAQQAFENGDLDEPFYVQLRQAFFNHQLEISALEEILQEQQIALELLIGSELPINSSRK